ncbi:MAG: methionyl-tRNA formyltransferase [Deinococcota bacterium]
MRVALFGSPAFAVPSLERLHSHHELVLVVTQPDKKAGRGLTITSPATAQRAKELGLQLEQPARLKTNEAFANVLTSLDIDVAVTAAYGKILPKTLLDIPKYGFLNVHGSLLPKYRGAAPIQWALINGDAETGITIMQTDVGMDTGDIRLVERLPIGQEDDASRLFARLAELGAEAIVKALDLLEADNLPRIPQDDSLASHARMLTKDDGQIIWDDPARDIWNRYRGVSVWPKSWTLWQGKPLKVLELELGSETSTQVPGEIVGVSDEGITVSTGNGIIRLTQVQPSGKAAMHAKDFANGYQVKVGTRFG